MAWFRQQTQVCFGISVSNLAVGRSLTIVSYVAFKMAALWFWTVFNWNPPIAHCHPLLWGGGILVDHWSTISSSNRELNSPQLCVISLTTLEYNPMLKHSCHRIDGMLSGEWDCCQWIVSQCQTMLAICFHNWPWCPAFTSPICAHNSSPSVLLWVWYVAVYFLSSMFHFDQCHIDGLVQERLNSNA